MVTVVNVHTHTQKKKHAFVCMWFGCYHSDGLVVWDGVYNIDPNHVYTHAHTHTHVHTHVHAHTHTHAHAHTGLVADCPLTEYIPSTCSPQTTDNDGLWTSLLVVAESFRYHVTKDPQAQSNAWALFKGMKFLNDVCQDKAIPVSALP